MSVKDRQGLQRVSLRALCHERFHHRRGLLRKAVDPSRIGGGSPNWGGGRGCR